MVAKSTTKSARPGVTRRGFALGAGVASVLAASPWQIARAQTGALKVGVLLPRSGAQAGIGQDCQRGVEIAPPIFKELGLPELAIMNADTETSVEVARARAEKLINDGAQLLVGAFDSGQSTAIAQVAEQKGIPFVINIAAAPQITEQGYKFVFRNFPTAGMILSDAFANQKEIFEAAGAAPKSVVFMHVNDTFGTSMQQGINAVLPKFDMPYKIVEQISYDPTARDLSVEVAKAHPGINLNTNHVYTFEALLVAADAFKRARSTDPKALADAIRATNITDNVSIGPGIQFNEKGQNDKLKNAAIQDRGGKLLTVAPKAASNAKAELPMTAYDKRS